MVNFCCRPAFNVLLRDATFPPADFHLISGMAEVKWDKIAAGANVSHAIVLVPVRAGYFNFTSADVTYKATESATEAQVQSFADHLVLAVSTGSLGSV